MTVPDGGVRCIECSLVSVSVVTKALDAETETKTEAAGFETEAKTEAVYLKTEAEAQGSWTVLLTVLSFPHR